MAQSVVAWLKRIMVAAALVGAAAVALPPGAAASLSWGTGVQATLPANAATSPGVSINAISCASAGNCTAVGTYHDTSGNTEGLLLTETSGTWAAGVEAPLPADASTTQQLVFVSSVSCTSPGNCTAVGTYTPSANSVGTEGLLLSETAGVWSASTAPLPADAVTSFSAGLEPNGIKSVSCPSAGNCTAVGAYNSSSAGTQGLLLMESSGSWTAAAAPLPADATTAAQQTGGPNVTLRSVSCASVGNCGAVGAYSSNAGADTVGVLLSESSGTWSATEAPLPANAGSNPVTTLNSISCASAGNCSTVGWYLDGSNNARGLLLTDTAGAWGSGIQAALPANAATSQPRVSNQPPLISVSCSSPGNCSAVGGYIDTSGAFQGLLLTESSGTWATGVEASLPANAVQHPASNQFVPLTSVSCTSPGNCAAVGDYVDNSAGTNFQGLLLSEDSGVWGTGVEAALPANAGSAPQATLSSVSCPSAGACGAAGGYQDSAGHAQGLLLNTGSAAPAGNFSWTGGAPSGTPNWSNAANWGGAAPSGSVGTLTFADLGNACDSGSSGNTCYTGSNDITGLSASAISIDDGNHSGSALLEAYSLSGNPLTLGAAGGTTLTAAPGAGDSGSGGASILFPITLGASQTWSITGGGPGTGRGLNLAGAVTGSADTLGIGLSSTATLNLTADDEVGAVTVTGSGPSPGLVALGGSGKLNASDGSPVSFSGGVTLFAAPGTTGPLSMSGGQIIVGGFNFGGAPAGLNELTVDGSASLDSASTLEMFINQAGASPTAGSDYSQLSATGNVTLAGTLQLEGGSGSPPACPTLTAGDVLTLVTTSGGALSGTFSNAPAGSTLTVSCPSGTSPTVRINYTATSVTATVVAGASPNATATTTSLTAAPMSVPTNQTVVMAATVTASSGSAPPSGTVTFLNNNSPISGCASQPLSGSGTTATVTCPTSFAAVTSPESLTATYTPANGSGFQTSTSPPVSVQVGQDATSTALAASNNSPQVGQNVTYTATVTPADPGPTIPSGGVAFLDGGSPISSCMAQPVIGGQATCTVSYSASGPHAVMASYAGDSNFTGSTSSAQRVNVSTPTTATLSASPSSPVTNQTVTLSASVSAGMAGTPTGTVSFLNGSSAISGCSAQPLTSAGTATCQTAFASASSPVSLSATYTPSSGSGFKSSAASLSLAVSKDASSTVLTVSNSSPLVGQNVTYTAIVAPAHTGPASPGGAVTFSDAGTPIGSCPSQPLTNGQATCTISYPSSGTHTITASYVTDSNFSGSTSGPQTVNVASAGTPTSTSLSSGPTSAVTNQTVTLTATVTASSGTATPAGAVEFVNQGAPIAGCTAQSVAGSGTSATATCSTSFAAASSPQSLTAVFTPASGSGFQGSSTASAVGLTVDPDASSTSLTVSNSRPSVGKSVTYTASVSPAHSGTVAPSGTVEFLDGSSAVSGCSAQSLSGGQATCTVTYSTPGLHTISVAYGGDSNFTRSSAPGQTVTVPAPPPPAPKFSSSPDQLNFSQPGGPRTLSVTNTGDAPLRITGVSLGGAAPEAFQLGADHCTGQALAPGQTCSVEVSFNPTVAGTLPATLNFADNADGSPQLIPLSGTSTAAIDVSPDPLGFGTILAGTAAVRTVTVTDTGTGPLRMFAASASPPGDYGIASDTCSGQSIAPGNTCTIAVVFIPSAKGTFGGDLLLTDDVPDHTGPAFQTIALGGNGTVPSTPGSSGTGTVPSDKRVCLGSCSNFQSDYPPVLEPEQDTMGLTETCGGPGSANDLGAGIAGLAVICSSVTVLQAQQDKDFQTAMTISTQMQADNQNQQMQRWQQTQQMQNQIFSGQQDATQNQAGQASQQFQSWQNFINVNPGVNAAPLFQTDGSLAPLFSGDAGLPAGSADTARLAGYSSDAAGKAAGRFTGPRVSLVLAATYRRHPTAADVRAFDEEFALAITPTYSPARAVARLTLMVAMALGRLTIIHDLGFTRLSQLSRLKSFTFGSAHARVGAGVKARTTLFMSPIGGRVARVFDLVGLSHKIGLALTVIESNHGQAHIAHRQIRIR